ncbi:MAG TPA: PH domain-containing protein [Thermoleophilaceae bacterium]|nr:PH domain-containing protein [Thermoleophilaceae bacterium]
MDIASDERILFQGHPSWRSVLDYYLKGLMATAVVGGVAALAGLIADGEVNTGWIAAAVLVALALMVVIGLVKRIATTYTITNRRLHIRRGIISRRVQETRLDRVQNVNTNQSALQRLLRVGDVDFDTAGGDDFEFAFKGVANPEEVVHAVNEAQREAPPSDT